MDLSRDEDSSGTGNCDCDCYCIDTTCECILFFIGLSFIIIGVVDMIVLFTVPTVISNKNKKKYPDATFEKPITSIIVCHFFLHIGLIIIGISLMLFGGSRLVFNILFYVGLALFICVYISLSWIIYKKSRTYSSFTSIAEITEKINNTSPIDFFFLYGTGEKRRNSDSSKYSQCYSKKGVKYYVSSKRKSDLFNFSNVPSLINLDIKLNLIYHDNAQSCLDTYSRNVLMYSPFSTRVIEETYPTQSGFYAVSDGKIPIHLKKSSKYAAMFLGAAVFYEVYSKSVPYYQYTMDVDIYSKNGDECRVSFDSSDVGECDILNKKPKP